jgi:hypothetical protein
MKVQIGKHLFDTFPIQNVLKQGDALLSLFFKFALKCDMGKFQEARRNRNLLGHIIIIIIFILPSIYIFSDMESVKVYE